MDVLCPWEAPVNFIFSSNTPTLLYYSHFVALLAALIFVFILLPRVRESLSVRWFLFTIIFFSAWTIIDVLLWASNSPSVVLFYWNLQVLLEMCLYSSAFYFAYSFITGKSLDFLKLSSLVTLILPVVVLLPTKYILIGIDVASCNAIENNFLLYYVYAFEILLSFLTLFVAFREIRHTPERRNEIMFLTTGVIIFLLAFSSGNIVGSITDDWALAQIGLFGMPVFIVFLAYTTIKFKAFNVKLFGTQALILVLWLLTLSQLFVRTIDNIRIIVIANLALFSVIGFFLVQSVRREIEAKEREHAQKEEIESLATNLEKSNTELETVNEKLKELSKAKDEFLSIATHQLKAPLSSIRGAAANILDGSFGKVPAKVQTPIENVMHVATGMVTLIDDYLNISRIEQGRMKYELSDFDITDVTKVATEGQMTAAKKKGLDLTFVGTEKFLINADIGKMTQVINNLVDNAVKYTPKGFVKVSAEKIEKEGKNFVRVMVSDSGIGIDPEEIGKLFHRFSRAADANKTNTQGTGLGLYVAKQLTEGCGGTIRIESEGLGKGSQFIIEFPIAKADAVKTTPTPKT